MKKRILSIILTLVMLFGMMPTTAFATLDESLLNITMEQQESTGDILSEEDKAALGVSELMTVSDAVYGGIQLYGTTQTYTVYYDANNGTGTMSSQTTNVGTATIVSANEFTRAGYTFIGWNTAVDGKGDSYAVGADILPQDENTIVTLYAQWKIDTIKVTGIDVKGTGDATVITKNGGTLQMIAEVTPATATYKEVTWSVENGTGSATINETGLLTAITNGTVTVKAAAKEDPTVVGSKVITISDYTFDISKGDITVEAGSTADTIKVTYGSAQTTTAEFANTNEITLTGTTNLNKVVVDGVRANITLDAVSIIANIDENGAFELTNSANVTLTLKENTTNILTSGVKSHKAGLQVPTGTVIEIGGTGKLFATGGGDGESYPYGGAGIGGCAQGESGTINISGGDITAASSSGGAAAGIGGGWAAANGTINISGGKINAIANGGAAIGGGTGKAGGTINISGGEVTATNNGNSGAAAIGGGGGAFAGAGGVITISGNSTVIAVSSAGGAGIGAGINSQAGGATPAAATITISAPAKVIAVSRIDNYAINARGTNGALESGSTAKVLMANFTSLQNGNNKTEVYIKGTGTSIIGFTPSYSYKSIAFTVPSNSTYLLETGAYWMKHSATTDFDITANGLTIFNNVTNSSQTEMEVDAPTGLKGLIPTAYGLNDGRITGVNDKMEYRLGNTGVYTAITASATEITGLAAGTYEVRYAAKTGFKAGAIATVIVPAPTPPTYTVTYDSQDATINASPTSKTVVSPATTVGSLPTPPQKTGFTFGGWFTAINGGGTEFTANTAVNCDISVYAKWTASSIGITRSLSDPYLFANGNEIIISSPKGDDKANIYIDANANGGIDENEAPVDLSAISGSFTAPQGNTTDGFDLSNYRIFGGSTKALAGDTKITMLSGKVMATYGAGYYNNSTVSNTTITIKGGSVNTVCATGPIDNTNVTGTATINIDGGNIMFIRLTDGYSSVSSYNLNINGGSVAAVITPAYGGTNVIARNQGSQILSKTLLRVGGSSAPVVNTRITAIDIKVGGVDYSYGMNDMFTDSYGYLYLWLPTGAAVANVTVGDNTYSSDGNGNMLTRSSTPTTSNPTVAKISAQSASFTLTNNPAYANGQTWKVYDAATGGAVVAGVTATNVGNQLTLTHDTDIPTGTYYVSVTETGKTESTRITLTVGAYAQTKFDVGLGDIEIIDGTAAGTITVNQSGNAITMPRYTQITITGTTTANKVKVNVTGSLAINITLDNVNIDVSATKDACAFDIQEESVVNLTLTGNNTLKSGSGKAGLQIQKKDSQIATATIGGTGTLNVIGGTGSAGIGGGQGIFERVDGISITPGGNVGSITINSGTVTATGGSGGAGIGGGAGNFKDLGGTITINGGTITATGNNSGGAGIGDGDGNDNGCTIKIIGGRIIAKGGDNGGAGIGGGRESGTGLGSPGNITIMGTPYVKAQGGSNGAGIGSGLGTYNFELKKIIGRGTGIININGGTIEATGGQLSAGIGGGRGNSGGTITISGGFSVMAIGDYNSAGIGGGEGGKGATIKINQNANVAAVSKNAENAIDDTDGIIEASAAGKTVANILMANYASTVAPNTTTTIKKGGAAVFAVTPIPHYKSIAFTIGKDSYTLYNGVTQQTHGDNPVNKIFEVSKAGLNIFKNVKADSSLPTNQTYTIVYNANGGSGNIAAQTTNVGTPTIASENGFTREGYTFKGWNTAADGKGTAYAAGASISSQAVNTTITLYAQWIASTPAEKFIVTVSSGTGGGQYAKDAIVTITASPAPTDKVFDKWTIQSGSVTLADAASATTTFVMPNSNVSVTATYKDVPKEGSISGTVTDEDNKNVDGATVKVTKGGTNAAAIATQTTAANGQFTFTGLKYGVYSLVVEKDGRTVTKTISVDKAAVTQNVKLLSGNKDTVVEVEQNTPPIAADNLENMFTTGDTAIANQPGTKVEIKLVVEKKEESNLPAGDKEKVKGKLSLGEIVGMYLDAKLLKTITGAANNADNITNAPIQPPTDQKVTITVDVPADLQNKAPYSIVRVHGDEAEVLPATYNSTLHTLTFEADKFSTYAIAYTEAIKYNLIINLNGGSGNTISGKYASGNVVSINAGSRSGYSFNGWTSSQGGAFANPNSSSTTFTMPANDTTITANWTRDRNDEKDDEDDTKGNNSGGGSSYDNPTITTDATEGGTISQDGKTITITPDKGYEISDVFVDGKSIGAVTKYTFEDATDKHTIKVIFIKASETNSSTGGHNPFADVTENDWFFDAVLKAYEKGLMMGTSKDAFSPYLETSRAMITTIIHGLEGKPAGSGQTEFDDVIAGEWYSEAIDWGNEKGIVLGYGDGTFKPEQNITREELCAILYRYAKYKGYDLSKSRDLLDFADSKEVSNWALDNVKWAVGTEMMKGKGDGMLDPKGFATRAEVCVMMLNLMNCYAK